MSQFDPVIPPIYQTVAFWHAEKDGFSTAASAPRVENFYTRYGNPTVRGFENAVAELEGAEAALATASGMAAITSAVLALVSAGDHIIAQTSLYGGTMGLLTTLAPRLGIEVTLVDQTETTAFAHAIRPTTRLIVVETPSNPLLRLTNLEDVAALGRKRGIVTLVDSTVASPVNQRPLDAGVDLVMHSATKYLAGHGDVMAGVLAGSLEMIEEVWKQNILLGGALSPHSASLAFRGLLTLRQRMAVHNVTAFELARWLEGRAEVSEVHYPGLESHPQHELARHQMAGGFGGLLSFEVVGGEEAGERLVSALNLAKRAVSFGAPKTLVVHPAAMWRGMMDGRDLVRAEVPAGLIRLGVGLEPIEEIKADLEQALLHAAGPHR